MSLPRASHRARPLGTLLLGSPDQSVTVLRLRVQLLLTGSLVIANVIGVAVVITLITVVIPGPSVFVSELALVNFVGVPVYVALALVIGVAWGTRGALSRLRWVFEETEPDEHDRKATLGIPLRLFRVNGALWLGATVLFTTIHALVMPETAFTVAFTVAAGGIVVSANAYLLSELALRPVAARALSSGPPLRRKAVSGLRTRIVLAWLLGSGVPVAGLMLVGLFALIRGDVPSTQLSVAILALGLVTLVFGLLLVAMMTGATVAPIRTVRAAQAEVERGNLDADVVVFDGTELGLLQSGFNRMLAGLRERELIRDLFGRQVGHGVARESLSRDIELGGEVREVTVLFVDLVGSTKLAATRPPAEVVALLNRFFSVVVAEVHDNGGFVNKFEGDAALAVFGAPDELPCAEQKGLAAARVMGDRLRDEVPECAAGIGVAAGPAVAGNIGAQSRFEYTVIGDPVNEAARLTEFSKSVPQRVVAAERVTQRAGAEAEYWRVDDEVTLRGRSSPTRVALPVTHADAESG